jgi:hypothetical protein
MKITELKIYGLGALSVQTYPYFEKIKGIERIVYGEHLFHLMGSTTGSSAAMDLVMGLGLRDGREVLDLDTESSRRVCEDLRERGHDIVHHKLVAAQRAGIRLFVFFDPRI